MAMLPFLLALCPLALGDESICVSNKGHPYDKAHCEEVAQKYGCVFKDNQCVCANGGYYAKTSHHCYPPSPTTASTTTSTTTTTTTPLSSSMCVSNRGRPYDESDCGWIAKDYGCTWSNGHCYCKNGGTFAKTSKFCWPPDTPTNQPGPKKSRDWWHVLDFLVTWCPGPEWVSWIMDLVLGASCCALPSAWRALQHRRPMRSLTAASQPLRITDEEDHVEVVTQHRSQ